MRLHALPASEPLRSFSGPLVVTLIELLVIVIIVGILAAVGVAQLGRTTERGYYREAQDILMTIYHGERAYYWTKSPVNPRGYYPPPGDTRPFDWNNIFMDDPNVTHIPVSFTLTSSGSNFTATATRTAGPCDGYVQTITEQRVPLSTDTWPASGVCP